jgi:hypothetical protein
LLHVVAWWPKRLIGRSLLAIVREKGEVVRMRVQGAIALVIMLTVAGCGSVGPKDKPDPQAADSGLINKPKGPGLVDRCPVPVSYDNATLKKIQDALQALPSDNVLHKTMNDYEAERDNLRMCH